MKQNIMDKTTKHISDLLLIFLFVFLPQYNGYSQQANFKLNDQGVFKKHGVDLMIYNDSFNSGGFFDEKVNGIEMIQHGVRTVTGGAVRLSPTPEQWDLVPTVKNRVVSVADNSVMLTLYYKEFDFTSKIKVEAKGSGCSISVILDKPLPQQLEGKAGMNIEFLPSTYFKKTYMMDDQIGICPLVSSGPMVLDPFKEKIPQFDNLLTNERFGDSYAKVVPLATGKKLVLSPDDPKSLVTINSLTGEIGLLDGRNLAPNGWFVVREVIPSRKTGTVVQWMFTPNSISDWIREPVISHSQVGYHPDQKKVAVIELDPNDKPLASATLLRIGNDGRQVSVLNGRLTNSGKFMRYNYLKFDFSTVKESGIYKIKYGSVETEPFPISKDVYKNSWYPTLDVWFPEQMDHMFVKEGYHIWHGNAHMDDALQAPTDTTIHDGYRQGHTTDSPYKPYEYISGLNIGGWFDAGDFDIQTRSHCQTISYMVGTWDDLKLKRDETMVDQGHKYVAIHHPDGVPDLIQQIEHGALALIAQHRAVGHAISGIIESRLFQYNQVGDAGSMTDNRIYNSKLKPFESDGFTSGTFDDRWAFTNYNSSLNIQSAGALAAASRALRSYNDALATECLETAKRIWEKEVANKAEQTGNKPQNNMFGFPADFGRSMSATQVAGLTVELLLSTGDKKYAEYLTRLWPSIKSGMGGQRRGMMGGSGMIRIMLKAIPYMNDNFKNDLRLQAMNMKKELDSLSNQNPYGVPLGQGGFYTQGGNFSIVDWALTAAKLYQYFPDIISKDYAIRGLDYVLGCHPASSISFVTGVGVNSKKVTYGNNRADFTAIPGGMVPGIYLIKPDFYENKEDWPFIWYENEVVIDGCAGYIYLASLVDSILKK
jgi:endoglucanase